MKRILTSLLIGMAMQVHAQIIFDTSKPVDSLIQDFVGSGITLSNVTFTGGSQSLGSFNGSSSLGSSQGIAFSTGIIDSNVSMPASQFLASSFMLPGDSDLSALAGAITYDAAVLEFDFVATNSTLLFDYVFASEEYNEYANTAFNDVFAFYISGPGIAGKQNIALIPSTTVPVAINNVNNGQTGTGPCMNCAYYHDNMWDMTVAFDGFTLPLTATYTLIPSQTYHLKLCVADASDATFDTGVFLQKYSLRSESPAAFAETILDKSQIYVFDKSLHINLLSNSKANCIVYGIDGKKVLESQLTEINNTFSLENINSGIYSVVLNLNGKTLIKKIVVQ